MRDDLDVLEEIWAYWRGFSTALEPSLWNRPTRCPGWTAADILAHVSQGIGGLHALATRRVVDGPPEHRSAAEVMRALRSGADAADRLADSSARRATEDAAQHTIAELLDRFAQPAADAIAHARRQATATVDYFRHGTTTLQAAAHIRISEAVIHLFDVCDAVGQDADPPDAAVRRTVDLLVDLTPPRAFIEFASGRTAQHPFPVLS